MEVSVSLLRQCPKDVDLVIFCRIVAAEEGFITIEDLLTREHHEAEVDADTGIPEEFNLPTRIVGRISEDNELKVLEIQVIDGGELLQILTDPLKLQLLQQQFKRGTKIHSSRSNPTSDV